MNSQVIEELDLQHEYEAVEQVTEFNVLYKCVVCGHEIEVEI